MNHEKFARYKTEFGLYEIGYKDGKITYLKAISKHDENIIGKPCELTQRAFEELNEYFEGKRCKFDLPLLISGSDFQIKVWQALCEIPYGETRTYAQIAKSIGNPKAARAVGMANHKNPIAIIVPCHRVIGSNGSLTGYAYGLELKKALLDLESRNSNRLFQNH